MEPNRRSHINRIKTAVLCAILTSLLPQSLTQSALANQKEENSETTIPNFLLPKTLQHLEVWQIKKNPEHHQIQLDPFVLLTGNATHPYQYQPQPKQKTQILLKKTPFRFQNETYFLYEYDLESDTCIGWVTKIIDSKETPIAEISDSSFAPISPTGPYLKDLEIQYK